MGLSVVSGLTYNPIWIRNIFIGLLKVKVSGVNEHGRNQNVNPKYEVVL